MSNNDESSEKSCSMICPWFLIASVVLLIVYVPLLKHANEFNDLPMNIIKLDDNCSYASRFDETKNYAEITITDCYIAEQFDMPKKHMLILEYPPDDPSSYMRKYTSTNTIYAWSNFVLNSKGGDIYVWYDPEEDSGATYIKGHTTHISTGFYTGMIVVASIILAISLIVCCIIALFISSM